MASRLSSFLVELKQRRVYRAAAIYAGVGVAIALAVPDLFGALLLPAWAPRFVIVLLLLGFPVALVLAWAYEVRPDGGGKVASSSDRPSIAVLPFEDFSPKAEDAYFANGIHEEILTQLQKIRGLSVRGRTSVLQYRERPKPLPAIAAELGVDYILEGSARKAGDQIRLTAQLIEARKDEHLWAENYDRPLTIDNLFSVQSDLAQRVARSVGVLLTPEEESRVGRAPTGDLKAYDYYLAGRFHIHRWNLGDVKRGLALLEKSVEVDPAFARGHAGVAYAYAVLGVFGEAPHRVWPRARAAAERALSMDASQAEAHNALALEAMSFRHDWTDSEARFRMALEQDPGSVEALDWLGVSLAAIWGRTEEAKAFSHRAMVADPLSMTVRYHQGIVPLWAGELQEAWEAFSALEGPGSALFLKSHGRAYVHAARGEYREALEALSPALGVAEDHRVIVLGFMGCLEGRLGMEKEARNRLLELDGLESGGIHVDPVSRAQIHVGLGNRERALALLEEGYEERAHWMIYLGNPPWDFSELRTEPRFQKLLAKMNFPRIETGGIA